MPDEIPPINYLKQIGETFKLGSGVLGKSAIAIGIFILVGGLAIFRLKSDGAILLALGVLFAAFFLWFFPVIRFVDKHPDAALLEGAEWMQFQTTAKGYTASPADRVPTAPLGTEALTITVTAPKPDEALELHD
ncbi:MAG TPA: hypothetical protein VFF64_23700 [Candidatus Eremiobacteraceae bacterium]|nr:hypothetical protein [Candidatus Eremiobacteraceae bacterium]